MDNRGHQPKNFGFTRDVKGNNSRVRPADDDENDIISMNSIDQNSPVNGRTQSNDTLLQTTNNFGKENRVPLNKKTLNSSSTSMKRFLTAGGILLGISFVVVLSTVLGVILKRNPTVTAMTTSSTAAPTATSAYWSFDYNVNDLYGVYNGALVNSPTYSNTTYFGYGSILVLSSTANQSVIVSSPFFNLSYTSFTVEAWIYGLSLTGDNAIFSQCQCNSCQDQCLYLIIRNYKLYMGFTLDDVIGTTILSINTWYHIAYVYDYTAGTQSVYVQGVLDNSKTSAGPYQGQNGSIVIGSSQFSSSSFNGYIDNLKLTTRAKSATEILADATVVVYFSFDGSSLSQDMGPNQMNGTLSNTAVVAGRVGQALAFSGAASSYLQIYGFYQLGQSSKPYSFAMWVYPYSVAGGVLIQKSTYANSGGWCYALMGLTYSGQTTMIVYNSVAPPVVGPILAVRTWTHLGYTYSTTNGLTMYINGTLWGTTGATGWSSSGYIDWLSIGSYVNYYCGSSVIYSTPYLGAIDEIYVYRRELNASDMFTLANP